jgi:hypothetical protein
MRRRELGCALALCLLPAVRDDAAVQLRSAKVDDRLAGVETLRKNGAKDAEALLKGALKDADWEVVERAAAALTERGSPASVDALGKIALDGPARRLRIAAARAMAKLDPAAASAAFSTRPARSRPSRRGRASRRRRSRSTRSRTPSTSAARRCAPGWPRPSPTRRTPSSARPRRPGCSCLPATSA